MYDCNEKERLRLKSQLATESTSRHHAALVNKSINRQPGSSNPQGTEKKTIYEQEKQNHSSRCDDFRSRITDIRARQRTCRYQRGNKHGDLLLRSRHEAHLRHRCRGGSHRRHQGVWQVLIWRPRHEQDCRKLVRSLHLPHRECNHPPLVLPII